MGDGAWGMGHGGWKGGVHDRVSLCFLLRTPQGKRGVHSSAERTFPVNTRWWWNGHTIPRVLPLANGSSASFPREGLSALEHQGGHHGNLAGPESVLTRKKKSRFTEMLPDPRVSSEGRKKSRFRFF